jgi:hypothetical protein
MLYYWDGPIVDFFAFLFIITFPFFAVKYCYIPLIKGLYDSYKQYKKKKARQKEVREFLAQYEAEKAAKAAQSEKNS